MEIKEERKYCLNCINRPCEKKGCPLKNYIPDFIKEENEDKDFEIMSKTTVLSAICGRVCPYSKQCQGSCTRKYTGNSVQIGKIEAYLGDKLLESDFEYSRKKPNGKKIAVIGSGPSGLTCAAFLAMEGFDVTIFERFKKLGGLLRYGIPDFRLDRDVIEKTISKILNIGINVIKGKELGKDLELSDLTTKFDAIYLAIGANQPNITLDGENILSGNKLLEDINLNNKIPDFNGKKVAISGGGNVAMDAARTLKRMGAEVTVVYRRSEKEMPAEVKEIEIAKEEGVNFEFLTNILKRVGNNKLLCIKTKLIQREDSDRLVPINIEGSEFEEKFDYVVLATGSISKKEVLQKQGLKLDENGYVIVDEKMKTNLKNVYSGGDLIGTKATVAWAAANGREAAKIITEELSK